MGLVRRACCRKKPQSEAKTFYGGERSLGKSSKGAKICPRIDLKCEENFLSDKLLGGHGFSGLSHAP